MATGSARPDPTVQTDPDLSRCLDAVSGLGAGRFDVLGPLGKDQESEYAFLARGIATGRLVVLKRRLVGSPAGSNSAVLQVIEQLDASVPPPAGACVFCHTPFGNWGPSCPDCGVDIPGSNVTIASEADRDRLLDAVRRAAPGYEILGDMTVANGGGAVFFARDRASGHLVAVRLEQDAGGEQGSAGQAGMTVAVTRMMRPQLTYGAAGHNPSGSRSRADSTPPWTGGAAPAGSATRALFSGGGSGQRVCPQCGEAFAAEVKFCPRDGSALRAADRTEDLIGEIIAERYHILRMLGEGGMGRVYLAEHVRMGRTCAVKVMNPKLLYDPDSVSRFSREAANASRITHPNVAAIYDFGEANDIVYIAMEYVDGPSLAGVLAGEPRLDERRVVRIGTQVAEALAAAHDFGIVHRDLKPDNVMLTKSRTGEDLVKVVDFGIAKATGGGRQTVTRTGFVIGTPAYMSPEQILGEVLDGRSDIYSLGCILYEMITGQRAFVGPSGEVSIHQRLTEPPPRARLAHGDISELLDRVITKALARSPDQRFQTAGELRDALSGVGAEAVEESSGSATTMLRHRSSRTEGPRPGWLIAACAGLVAIAFGGWMLLRKPLNVEEQAPIKIPATPTEPVATAPATPPPAAAEAPSAPVETVDKTPDPASATGQPGTVAFDEPLPGEARVTVDGKETRVPNDGTLSLPPGPHTIRVRVPGFRALTRSVRVVSGETAAVTLGLVPEASAPASAPATPSAPPPSAAPGTIAIQGNLPEGAILDVDGRPLAIGVRSVSAPAGRHWVRVSVPGYRSDSSLIEVISGQESGWTAPALVALVKPAPAPAPAPPVSNGPAGYGPSAQLPPSAPPPAAAEAASESQIRAEVVTLLSDYEKGINARNLDRLKTLFPSMAGESERRWRDLFGKDVSDLKAVVTLSSIVPASAAQIVTFKLLLTFKPNGGKPQKYQLTEVGTVRRESAGWRFIDLIETGN